MCGANGFLWLLFTGDLNNTLPSHSKCFHNNPVVSVALLRQELCGSEGIHLGLGDVAAAAEGSAEHSPSSLCGLAQN